MFPEYYSKNSKKNFIRFNDSLIANNETVKVINEIPRFVNDDNYASAFGEQWKLYRLTQLDSYTKSTITYDRMKRCMGIKMFESLRNKLVLEAGCGAGRFTEILLEQGAYVSSFDLSNAVDANVINFPINERHRVFQADINDLPFQDEQYDIVLSMGVIQHTPNPEETIFNLFKQVKPGGWLVLDHYTYRLSHYTKTTELFRFFLKRMEPHKGLIATAQITNFFFPFHKAFRKFYLLQSILSRISPVHSYYFAYPQLSHEDQYKWALLDTHDSLTDWYKHLRFKGQILKLLRSIGGKEIYCEYSSHGIDARCKK